jgi:hypothetical protein
MFPPTPAIDLVRDGTFFGATSKPTTPSQAYSNSTNHHTSPYQTHQCHHILSETGPQQGDPLGTVLFAAPLQLILHRVANSHPDNLVFAFADNASFIRPPKQVLQAVDTYYHLLQEANLKLNPAKSNIYYFPNPTQSQLLVGSLQTSQGLINPCTTTGIKMMGSH